MIENLMQLLILFFSSASIWCFAGIKYKRLGFIVGLCGQPLWFYTTYNSGQWGMFLLSIWFSVNHIRGLYNYRKMAR